MARSFDYEFVRAMCSKYLWKSSHERHLEDCIQYAAMRWIEHPEGVYFDWVVKDYCRLNGIGKRGKTSARPLEFGISVGRESDENDVSESGYLFNAAAEEEFINRKDKLEFKDLIETYFKHKKELHWFQQKRIWDVVLSTLVAELETCRTPHGVRAIAYSIKRHLRKPEIKGQFLNRIDYLLGIATDGFTKRELTALREDIEDDFAEEIISSPVLAMAAPETSKPEDPVIDLGFFVPVEDYFTDPNLDFTQERDVIWKIEREVILKSMNQLGNRTQAAKVLGISIRTLRNKLNEYLYGSDRIQDAS